MEDNLKRKTILFSIFSFPLNRIEILLQNNIKRNIFYIFALETIPHNRNKWVDSMFEKYNLFIKMSWELTCYAIEVNVDVLDICPNLSCMGDTSTVLLY